MAMKTPSADKIMPAVIFKLKISTLYFLLQNNKIFWHQKFYKNVWVPESETT
jgi:hypothetical protein